MFPFAAPRILSSIHRAAVASNLSSEAHSETWFCVCVGDKQGLKESSVEHMLHSQQQNSINIFVLETLITEQNILIKSEPK